MSSIIKIIITASLLLAPGASLASPGGLNSQGCHTCHTNCERYGLKDEEYHCHQVIKPSAPVSPQETGKSAASESHPSKAYLLLLAAVPFASFFAGRITRKRKT